MDPVSANRVAEGMARLWGPQDSIVELRRENKKLLADHKVEIEELIKENKRLLGEANAENEELRKQIEAEKARSVDRKRSRSPTKYQLSSTSTCSTSQQGNGCSPAGPTRPASLNPSSDGIITQSLPGTLPRLTRPCSLDVRIARWIMMESFSSLSRFLRVSATSRFSSR
jgi:hypothetical protein